MSSFQCCGSGMVFPDPGSWFLPIPDPGSKNSNKREGWKKISCQTFLCSHKLHKTKNYFIFEMLKKTILGQFSKNFLSKNLSLKSGVGIRDPRSGIRDPGSEIRDPGSGKNLFWIPHPCPGVKKAPDPGSGSTTLFPLVKSVLVWIQCCKQGCWSGLLVGPGIFLPQSRSLHLRNKHMWTFLKELFFHRNPIKCFSE